MYFCNLDLESIVTLVKVMKFVELLSEANYPREKTNFLQEGLVKGFDIGYEGPQIRQSTAENIPLTIGNETELWNKLMKEVQLKRVAGPFDTIPFDSYIQSLIGLVPKAGGDQTRLIFHLSYDCKSDGIKSLNHFTPKEKCTVKYRDLDYAVHAYIHLWDELAAEENKPTKVSDLRKRFDRGHKRINKKPIFAGKSDIKSAFRILGLSPKSWQWLVMKAKDPITKEWKFFVDKCLPFGASISCALFQSFSDALCHLFEFRLKVYKRITNYLDDFLFLARTLQLCNEMIQKFLNLCAQIGVPVAFEKTEWGSEIIIFLGILLDGRNMVLAIPIEKRNKAIELLQGMISKKKTTVKELQKLCGLLNFIGREVSPGRMFTRCMYSKYAAVINTGVHDHSESKFMDKYQSKLKQHHHVNLDKEFKMDCEVWLQFLAGDLHQVVQRPMVDLIRTLNTSENIEFYLDASSKIGFGAILDNNWLQGDWNKEFLE